MKRWNLTCLLIVCICLLFGTCVSAKTLHEGDIIDIEPPAQTTEDDFWPDDETDNEWYEEETAPDGTQAVTEATTQETTEATTQATTEQSTEAANDLEGMEFVDHMLPQVTPENFFARLYHKLFQACNAAQRVIGVILIIFFAWATVMVVVSFFGQKGKVAWYLLTMLVIAIMFVCDVYAVQIIYTFKNWFMS